jgi:hypothetical protein
MRMGTNRRRQGLQAGRLRHTAIMFLFAASCLAPLEAGQAQTTLQSIVTSKLNLVTNIQPPQLTYFTNNFPALGTNFLSIAPFTSQGLFYTGDAVTISNTTAATIEVYDYRWKPVTNSFSPLTLTNLGVGHYWVQCNATNAGGYGDRVQFTVLPLASSNSLHAFLGEQSVAGYTGDGGITSNRQLRLRFGWMRDQESPWSNIQADNTTAIVWTVEDTIMGFYTNGALRVPLLVFNLDAQHGTSAATPVWETTNTLAQWIHDFSGVYSNAAIRYGTNWTYEIGNEFNAAAVAGNLTFSETNWEAAVAMAVSATVKAVSYVCPLCQTWAPAQSGDFTENETYAITDAQYRVSYTNLAGISWHDGDGTSAVDVSPDNKYSAITSVSALFPGQALEISEAYARSPDPLGRTNSWTPYGTWYRQACRWSKSCVEWHAAGVAYALHWLGTGCCQTPLQAANDETSYIGWYDDVVANGMGPQPPLDEEMLWDWWLRGSSLLTNVYAAGVHYFEFQMPGGSTNTILWADESAGYPTNLGVYVSDVYSQKWPSLTITEEPVIAWGWAPISYHLTLSWQDNSVSSNQSAGYIIERGTNSPPSTIIAITSAGVQTNWVDTSPVPGVTNYYQIAAYNSGGTSSWSNVAGGLPH